MPSLPGVSAGPGHNGTQLDTISTASASQSWSLDALGNWSTVTTNGTATNQSFNAQDQTTSVSGGTAPTYNHNGDTTGDSGLTYVYNAWDQLVAVKSGSTTVASYADDALGRRITETYGSTTNHLYYSADWQVIEERQNGTAASNVTYQYVWGAGGVDELVLRDAYSGGAQTQRLYAQWNADGNVTALVNTSGTVVERYLYTPYGSVTVTDASWTPRPGNTSSYGWRYLFQGGRLDTTTGWYDFRNRDLIPSEGRWAERDPLGFGGGDTNLYRVEGSSPADGTDPLGLADGPSGPDEWPLWEGLKAGSYEFFVNEIGGGTVSLFTGEAGQALGERAVGMAEARTGQPFTGSAGDWGRFAQGVGGDLAGTNGIVEGLSGYDLPTQQEIDTWERWRRGAAGTGALAGNAAGGLQAMAKAPGALPNLSRLAKRPIGTPRVTPSPSRPVPARGNPFRVCFPAGTPISTPEGQRAIEDIREGDQVFAWDTDGQELLIQNVINVFKRFTNKIINISLEDGTSLRSTMAHPFWVVGIGWTIAGDLREGMELFGIDGKGRRVHDVIRTEALATVYNFEVNRSHNYFAGNTPVLVHNQNEVHTDFNRATNVAMEWLASQGVDTSKPVGVVNAKFGPHKGKPIGVMFEGGGYYRIEFDARSGAHINVGVRKTTGPHIRFEGGQKTVDNLICRLFRC